MDAVIRQRGWQNITLVIIWMTIAGGCIRRSSPTLQPESAIDNYARAVGGNSAWDTVRSRITRGTINLGPPGLTGEFTLTEAVPDRRLFVVRLPNGLETREGFDGQVGWVRGPQGQVREEPAALSEPARRERRLSRDPRLAAAYRSFGGITGDASSSQTVNLMAATGIDGSTDTLSFDRATGLLAHRRTGMMAPQGPVRVQIEFGDYRSIGRLAVPFEIVQRREDRVVALHVQSVEFNTPIGAQVFQKPR